MPPSARMLLNSGRKVFSYVMLVHTWESQKPLLHGIQDKVVYDLDPVITVVKMQTLCEVSHNAGHHWAWTRYIVHMSDVLLSSKSGALANSVWNMRGLWTKLWAFEFLSEVTDQTENM
ncbi:hypothetical protein EV424DRAFT_1453512 [Suillus variegatus]|nr:hypothetical protein EV424DRAFT_1453512 [Suillus variegatus]